MPLGDLEATTLHVVARFRPAHDAWAARGIDTTPGPAPGPFAGAMVFLPRNRVQGLAAIAAAARAVDPDGWLVIDGAKTDGIDAVIRELRRHLPVQATARDHGKVAWVHIHDPLPVVFADWEKAADPAPNSDGLMTAPGMFSADGIDPGTELLLDHLPGGASGQAADFGAGWGALARGALARLPGLSAMDLIEADYPASEAARNNLSDPRARVHWADVTGWTGGPYDLILSNPPFHQGRAAEPDLGIRFIRAAARCLAPKGRFLLVANRQLPYEGAMDTAFRRWTQVTATNRYKVISASVPRRA